MDAEHHRFGGLMLSGVTWADSFCWATTPAAAVGWFATGADSGRVYIRLAADRVRDAGVGRTVDAFLAFAAEFMPEGTLAGARQAGPMGFFPNSCTWSSRVAWAIWCWWGTRRVPWIPPRDSVPRCSSETSAR